jgi:DNA methylase/ParB-like nuclease family protein
MAAKRIWGGVDGLRRLLVPLDSLEPWPDNPRRGDVEAIRHSLERFGQLKPIVTQGSRIVAGHHIVLAALECGWTHVAALDGQFADDETARAFLLADNRTAELGTIDEEALAVQLAALRSFDGTGYTDDDRATLERRLLALRGQTEDTETGRTPPVPENPTSEPGTIYELGPHRLLCGDSFDGVELARLFDGVDVGCVLTDPPYGIDLDTDYRARRLGQAGEKGETKQGKPIVKARTYERVEGDAVPFDASMFAQFFADVREQFWFGANYYRRTLPGGDLDGSWLVWDKRPAGWTTELDAVSIDDVFGSGFELIWSRRRHQQRVLRHQWSGFTARNPESPRAHPTEKPVAILAEILDRWAPEGCVVADPFLGAGSTLLACERTGRVCYAVEMDAGYCDVVRQRYEELAALPS